MITADAVGVGNNTKAVATVPVPVTKLEYRHHTFEWGVVTHAQ